MKLITMFSKREYVVEDDEADKVAEASQGDGMIALRSGDYINPKGIESIGEVPKVQMYKGYFVEKDGMSYYRDGERIRIEHPEDRYWELGDEYQNQANKIADKRLKDPEVLPPDNPQVKGWLEDVKGGIGKPMISEKERAVMIEESSMQDMEI